MLAVCMLRTALQQTEQFVERMDFIVSGYPTDAFGLAVEEDCGESGLPCTMNVSVGVVANHQCRMAACACGFQGKVEEEGGGLIHTSVFTQHNGVETVCQPGCPELFVLHLTETIARHVEPIASSAQICHHLMRPINNAGLRGTELQKTVADLQAEGCGHHALPSDDFRQMLRPMVADAQRAAETLDDEHLAGYLAVGILLPELHIRLPIMVVEHFGMVKVLFQMENFIDFPQGDDGISMGVVERIVEIYQEVSVGQSGVHGRLFDEGFGGMWQNYEKTVETGYRNTEKR